MISWEADHNCTATYQMRGSCICCTSSDGKLSLSNFPALFNSVFPNRSATGPIHNH